MIEIELKAQFRCSGAEGFINWVTHILQIEDTANYDGWDEESFDFKLFDNPNDMYQQIVEKNNAGNKARIVAGYAWKWSNDQNANVKDVQIPERDFYMPWNARKDSALFAIKEDSLNQLGCIHTVQGLEFDYVGVIIGNDLRYNYNTGEIEAVYENYMDTEGKKGLKNEPEKLNQLVKNIYKVLMSRGTKGCYLYCRNNALQQHIKYRLGMDIYPEVNKAAQSVSEYKNTKE